MPSTMPRCLSARMNTSMHLGLEFVLLFTSLLTFIHAAPINILAQSNVYDYIVVGGGASGLTIANRLTEDKLKTVLVIEAGPADNGEDAVLIPGLVGKDIIGPYNWNYSTVPQTYLDGKSRVFPQGHGLGGGTLINAMLWNRGGQGDYNDWASLGNPGWDWASMLPYFMKSESFTYNVAPDMAEQFGINYVPSVHGTSGPVNVSYSNYIYDTSQLFFDGLNYMGVPTAYDPNDGTTAGGYFLPLSIDPNNMTRSSARLAHYQPFAARGNYFVLVGQQVTQLIFDNSSCSDSDDTLRVIGVTYGTPSTPSQNVYARREVILAAGSFHTPQLLELSGIGSASILQSYNITPKIILPGVGNNLQDHYQTATWWPYQNNSYAMPSNIADTPEKATWVQQQYYENRTGPWTAGPPDGVAFPSLPQISNISDKIVFAASLQDPKEYLAAGLDPTVIAGYTAQHQLLVNALGSSDRACFELLNANTGFMTQSVMRPFSRGGVHIASTDPYAAPQIDPRYGSNPTDLDILLAAVKFNMALWKSPPMQPLQISEWIPSPDSNDSFLLNFVKQLAGTEYHPSGSCAMLPLDLGGVVDSSLLVYGTQNLRIVDASIQPMPPAAHLEAVVYGVAEKAADLIKAAPAFTTNPRMILPPQSSTTACSSSPSGFTTTYTSSSSGRWSGPSVGSTMHHTDTIWASHSRKTRSTYASSIAIGTHPTTITMATTSPAYTRTEPITPYTTTTTDPAAPTLSGSLAAGNSFSQIHLPITGFTGGFPYPPRGASPTRRPIPLASYHPGHITYSHDIEPLYPTEYNTVAASTTGRKFGSPIIAGRNAAQREDGRGGHGVGHGGFGGAEQRRWTG